MKVLTKLRSRSGESLAEVLCAVLLAGIAISLLASMVTAAAKLNRTAALADEAMYTSLAAAEGRTQELSASSGNLNVTVENVAAPVVFEVKFYGVQDELISYELDESSGGP